MCGFIFPTVMILCLDYFALWVLPNLKHVVPRMFLKHFVPDILHCHILPLLSKSSLISCKLSGGDLQHLNRLNDVFEALL